MSIVSEIFLVLGVSVGVNILFFIFGFLLKNDVFTDITYASTFILTSLIIMLINKNYGVIQILMMTLVSAWSIRLGSFLFIRIRKDKVDHRFDKMRNSFWKFGAFWLIQGVTVWLVNMPTYVTLINSATNFNLLTIIPFVFAILFLVFETIADVQKYLWNLKNKGKFINKGLWKSSRHPNYFGEYMFWWMMMTISLINNFQYWMLISIIGPFFITLTLYMISGLPLLEKLSWKLFGNQKEYAKYLNKTPAIIPYIGKKGLKDKWKSE